MTTCTTCGATVREVARFCSSCGTGLAGIAPALVLAPPASAHTVADPGLQSYTQPDAASATSQVLPGGARVEVLETRAAWAQVRQDTGAISWVDGRRLIPPTAVDAPAHGPNTDRPTSGSAIGPDAIVGLVGAVGVIAGSLLSWLADQSGTNFSSFKLPVGNLFDTTNTSQDPKTGYFLVGAAIVGIVCCFVPRAGWVRIVCGGIAIAAPVLYAVQVNDTLNHLSYGFSSPSLTDVLGPGVWVTGIAGALLAISPAFRRRH